MELLARNFPNIGVVEGQLSEDVVDNIWKVVNEARDNPVDSKPELAGNISSSIKLDRNSELLKDFTGETIPAFMQQHMEAYGPPYRMAMKEGEQFYLESLWVNFQRQHEFNPPHDHAGVYSFVIWMQIPTSYEEQRKLPIAVESNADNHISNFAFSYTNTLGRVSTFAYNMEKEAEGYMVMFPSAMLHQVFPFYENDGERISISGNINIGELQ
tara:strand:+ start:1720 stop:2358 length:639 start_codon:yes stop_codon:yes gene_type:complete